MNRLQTVTGPIRPADAGLTLPHEHVMVDFIGADQTGEHRWDKDEVVRTVEPFFKEIREKGVSTFVDCTPKYLARDPWVLRELSLRTGIHILTNTGLYKEPYLPPYAFTDSPEELAKKWEDEATSGLDGTDILPGFVKIAVNPGPLVPVQQKLVRAAGLCSLATGLTIAVHTAHGRAALETVAILSDCGVPLSRYIFVHADAEEDFAFHREIAARGGWVEYDGIGARSTEQIVAWTVAMIEAGFTDRLLLSHDAGWYAVGEPGGGEIRPYTALFDEFLPALRQAGVDAATTWRILRENPARAYTVAE